MAFGDVLSAPSSASESHTLNLVILIVSVFSALGAGWIILSFLAFKELRTFRHQLILGLAISDFWMAVNFMSSASVNLSGLNIGNAKEMMFCSFNGFMIQAFVVQTDYWVLTIAVCTFLILDGHKATSGWIQDHRIVVWIFPWLLSLLWAALGLAVVGYVDIGAWCWFESDRTRLLVNFLPRWLIILSMLGLYIRLYTIIHRAHSRFASFEEDDAFGSLQSNPPDQSSSPRSINISQAPDDDCEQAGRRQRRAGRRTPPPVLKRISYQMMLYPLVYMLIWTIPTAIRIYQASTGKAAPFGIATVDKSCIVIQGFADTIVYGFNESTWRTWKTIFSRKK